MANGNGPLQTNKLPIAQLDLGRLNRVTGNDRNASNDIAFLLPRIGVRAVEEAALIASFSLLKARALGRAQAKEDNHANLDPSTLDYQSDDPEFIDKAKTFGELLSGQSVYGAIEFGNADPQNQSGNNYTGIDGKTYTFQNMVMPVAIITVAQPTNIVKTRITGRPGEIKQYIGALDKAITINTEVNMPGNLAPIAFLQSLQQMKDAAVPIPVTNYYLNALNIGYIVIEDISTGQTEGGYSTQSVTITACSDMPLATFLP